MWNCLQILMQTGLNININWFITGEGEMFNGEKSVNNDFCKEIEQIFIKVLEQRGL